MPVYRDEGVVLRTYKLGEADRIVSLLTRDHGRIRAVAKGVRKTTSRFGARLEPFSHVDAQFFQGRNLDTVTQAESIGNYGALITDDYSRWTSAHAMVETAERLTDEEREPAPQQYLLLVGGLRSLAQREHEAGLILDSYLLRSLSVAGWSPSFSACARCGAVGPHRAFSISSGGSVCAECRPPGSATPAPETLELLGALLSGEWAIADASQPRHRKEANGIVAAYLQWHIERGLRSLPLVDRYSESP